MGRSRIKGLLHPSSSATCIIALLINLLQSCLNGAQAQGLDTLIGIQGDGFVMLAADPVLHRSLVVMQKDRDKLPILSERRIMAIGGPPYFVDAISEILRAEVNLMEKRLKHPLSTKALAHMCRNMFLEYRGLPCTVLVAGFDEAITSAGQGQEGPCLYWMDTLGAIQRLRYAAHGEAASFLVSFLDQQCRGGAVADRREGNGDDSSASSLNIDEALDIIRRCYEELERRFLVNAGGAFQVKVVDRHGCRSLIIGNDNKQGRARIPPPPSPSPPPPPPSAASSNSKVGPSSGSHHRRVPSTTSPKLGGAR